MSTGFEQLRLEGLSKKYGPVSAVDGVTLTVEPGEFVSVIGLSGAGKTTLHKLINRLVDPTSGRILYGERDVSALTGRELLEWRSRCATIFQQFHLANRLDVATNVLMGRLRRNSTMRTLLGWFPREDRLLAARALERVGMLDRALERVDRLSGGQMQRVAIARALVQEPCVMLADEPISALDPCSARTVMETLQQINRTEGITVICNLHNLGAAHEYSTRIIGLHAGRVVYDGPPSALQPAETRLIYGEAVGEERYDSVAAV